MMLAVPKLKEYCVSKPSITKFSSVLAPSILTCLFICHEIIIFTCNSKESCNKYHTILAFIPIIFYLFVRNSLEVLRERSSYFFEWFGTISLELFISQYHIWLADDTHKVLILIPQSPFLSVILSSIIFVIISYQLNTITNSLIKYAVPSSFNKLCRNIIIFIILLIATYASHETSYALPMIHKHIQDFNS